MKREIFTVMNRVSWIGLLVAVFWATVITAIRFPFWMAIIIAAVGYWQGHSFSRQLNKNSPDPNLFLRNFFSAPGEKARYKKIAVIWFVAMNIIGSLLSVKFYYYQPLTTADFIVAWVGLGLLIIPPTIFLILSWKSLEP